MRSAAIRLAGLLISATTLVAQIPVTGQVVDAKGTPISNARITIKPTGSGLNIILQSVSRPTGTFSILFPSAGTYLVSIQCDGYFEIRDRLVDVTAALNIILTLERIRETFEAVSVRDSPTPLDPTQTGFRRTLSGIAITNIPYSGGPSVRNAVKLMPSVVQDRYGGMHFEGAEENQLLYTLNGFNIGDPLTGRYNTRSSMDNIQSLDFLSGRYSPEFGRGSAGVLAIHAEAGTDQLNHTATNVVPGLDTHQGLHFGNWSPRFSITGPVRRGRFWFADSFEVGYDQAYVNGLPEGENQRSGWAGSNLLHTQFNLKPSHILFAAFLANVSHQDRTGLGPLDPISTTTNQRSYDYFLSLKDQVYLSRGMLIELGYAHNYFSNHQIPQGNLPYVISPNGRSGNYFVNSARQTTRDQVRADIFVPRIQLAGTHDLKVGVDLDLLTYAAELRRTAYEQVGLSGELLSKTTFQGRGALGLRSLQASSYLLDSWQPRKNVTINLGVRQDWDDLIRRSVLSPRVSFAWSPFVAGRTRISAGYATTYDTATLDIFSRPLDQQSMTARFNPDQTAAGTTSGTAFTIDNSDLRPPRSANWSFGFDQQLPHNIYLSTNNLWRFGRDGFTYSTTAGDVFQLTNTRRDEYHSAAVSIRQSLADQSEWTASYIHSRAASNAAVDLSIDQPIRVRDNLGPVPWDAPERFLATAFLPVPRFKTFSVAVLVDARSGFPFSVTDETGQVVGKVNSHRFPPTLDLNLHIERRFTLHRYRFAIRAGFNNVTDHPNPSAVNSVIGATQYLQFLGNEGRHFLLRFRLLGRSR